MPDGYASNLGRCVDMENLKLFGMKSHNCHIFMQYLMPVAFSALPKPIWKSLTNSVYSLKICAQQYCGNKRVGRNDDVIEKNATNPTLSVFNYPDRSYGKKDGDIRWLDDKEVATAQLHVLIIVMRLSLFSTDGEEVDGSSFQAVVNKNERDIIEEGDENISNEEEVGDEETSSEEANDEEEETSEEEDFLDSDDSASHFHIQDEEEDKYEED
ncbi:hypothetical protein FXO38_15686 [Capsicum annuum]|nr:hypothetical protein FXO38_15686 [Capsicum annuum]